MVSYSLIARRWTHHCYSAVLCSFSPRTRIPWSRADCDCCATATRKTNFVSFPRYRTLDLKVSWLCCSTVPFVGMRLQQYKRELPSRTQSQHEVTSMRKSRFARGMQPLSCGMQGDTGHPMEISLQDTITVQLQIRTRSGPNHPSLYHARYIVARTETNENATC